MKKSIYLIAIFLLFTACSNQPTVTSEYMPQTSLKQSSFTELPNWKNEKYQEVIKSFINSCKTKKTKKMYKSLCKEARETRDARNFLETEFRPYTIVSKDEESFGLLTGYYEPELNGSLRKSKKYRYPIYETPSDLIVVDLSSIYPDLKKYRLRGKLDGNRVVPYNSRAENSGENSDIICYVDSKIDLFFLEIQGSGRVTLDNDEVIFVGYDNQNGHKYRAIGRYLVKEKELKLEDVSLQSIRTWLDKNPARVDEVLNYNDSVVYFKERNRAASGSLGLELTPNRSVAVDRKYIPLGSMLYLDSKVDDEKVSRVVMAQDTGGAIKGAVRADIFLGFGESAMSSAGKLKSPLKLWVFLPRSSTVK